MKNKKLVILSLFTAFLFMGSLAISSLPVFAIGEDGGTPEAPSLSSPAEESSSSNQSSISSSPEGASLPTSEEDSSTVESSNSSSSTPASSSEIPEEDPASLEEGLPLLTIEPTSLLDTINVAPYLVAGTNGRKILDLKLLKDDGLPSGTLLIEGTSADNSFVTIVDTSTVDTGEYNILLGEYGGVEIPAATGSLNTFQSIANIQGIANMMPIYTAVSVDAITINNNGSKINLLPTISFPIPFPSPTYAPTRNLGIAIVGENTIVNTLSVTDIAVSGYNQTPAGAQNTYVSPAFIGVQQQASVDTFTVGDISISYANAQIGTFIGAADGTINKLTVNGTVTFTGTIVSNGVPNATYGAQNLIGIIGSKASINELSIKSTAKINITNVTGDTYGLQIGIYSCDITKGEGRLVAEPGSEINFTNFKAKGELNIPIGGEAKVMDFGGKITMSIVSPSTSVFIGKGYNSTVANEMLLIRGSSEINIHSTNYVGVAIGYFANVNATNMKNFVIEKGARIDLSLDKPYSIRNYYSVDAAFGGSEYSSPDNFLIGATYNAQTGKYEVLPSTDTSNQTQIRLTNYRMLVHTNGSFSPTNFSRKAQLNANVYAEYNTTKSEFFGGYGYHVLVGGNYIAKETSGGTTHYISFNETRTGDYNDLNSKAYNQYFEPLQQKLYIDDTNSAFFSYHVPAEGFDGKKPNYDYTIPQSIGAGVPASYRALYYPTRALILLLLNPMENGTIPINDMLELKFDKPIYAGDNIDKGQVITILQGSSPFSIALTSQNEDLFAFGSDQPGGDPHLLYINLAKLTNTNGGHLAPNTMASVYVPASSFTTFLNQNDAQLTTQRNSIEYSTYFTPTKALYTVQFNLNGAPISPVPSQSILEGGTATEPSGLVWEEHLLAGWKVAPTNGNSFWNFTTPITSDLTLVAQWQTITYQVLYDGNGYTGGSFPVDNTPRAKGDIVTASSNSLTKTGYQFDGWKSSFDGSVVQKGGQFIMPGSDITLTAQWKATPASSSSVPPASSSSVPPASSSSVPPASSSSVPPASSSSVPPASSSTVPPASSSSVPPASSSSVPPASSSSAPPASSSSAPPASSSSSAPVSSSSSVPVSSSSSVASSSSAIASSISSTPPPSGSVSSPASGPVINTDTTNGQVTAQQREEVREQLVEAGVPTFSLGDTDVPLFGGNQTLVWSLLSLLLMVGGMVVSIVTAVKMLLQRTNQQQEPEKQRKRRIILQFVAIGVSILALILFFTVYNLSALMVIIDTKTILFAVLFAAELISLFFAKKRAEKQKYRTQ